MFRNKVLCKISVIVFIWNITVQGSPSSFAVEDILENYENNIVLLNKVSFGIETYVAIEGDISSSAPREQKDHITFYRDHNRLDLSAISEAFIENSENGSKETTYSQRVIDDFVLEYATKSSPIPKYAVRRSDSSISKQGIAASLSSAGSFCGFAPGANGKTLLEVLRYANDIKLRNNREIIDGNETVVIEAKTQYGTYTAWLDPLSGFVPRRITVLKTGDDLASNHKPISASLPQLPPTAKPKYPYAPIKQQYIELKIDEIQKVGSAFVPIRGIFASDILYVNGEQLNKQSSYTVHDINLDPDFAALGAFKINLPDGTPVFDVDVKGIQFELQDGKVVADIDDLVTETIDELAKEIVSEGDLPISLERDQGTENKTVSDRVKNLKKQDKTGLSGSKDNSENSSKPVSLLLSALVVVALTFVIGYLIILCKHRYNVKESDI